MSLEDGQDPLVKESTIHTSVRQNIPDSPVQPATGENTARPKWKILVDTHAQTFVHTWLTRFARAMMVKMSGLFSE